MKNLALPRIQKMKPYSPPLDNRRTYNGLLLDFNERTTPPSSLVRRALQRFVLRDQLQTYPEYFDLAKQIAKYVGVTAENILLTNGSEQGMDLVFRTFTEPRDEAVIPTPSYSMFYQFAELCGNKVIMPTYSENGKFPLEQILRNITPRTKLVVICNPNNPTGTLVSAKEIARIAQTAKNAVIYVDEAYGEYAGVSAGTLIRKYPNIIVSRTFSKAFGLGSLRAGYIVASPMYVAEFLKVRGPYDINMAAWTAAQAALKDKAAMLRYVREVVLRAKPLVERFFKETGIQYLPSKSNFILFKPEDAQKAFEILRARGFLTRLQNRPPLQNMLRVTIGTKEQMIKFIEAYRNKVLKQKYAFIDRDGTLIWEPSDTKQIDSLDKLKILPGVFGGLKTLMKNGYRLILVSNQDGLGTASFPKKDFLAPQQKMVSLFKDHGIVFDEIFICPHLPQANCACRKPKTGLINKWLAQNKGNIDWESSFVCGDRKSDQQFARNLDLRFVPVKTNGSFASVTKQVNL